MNPTASVQPVYSWCPQASIVSFYHSVENNWRPINKKMFNKLISDIIAFLTIAKLYVAV